MIHGVISRMKSSNQIVIEDITENVSRIGIDGRRSPTNTPESISTTTMEVAPVVPDLTITMRVSADIGIHRRSTTYYRKRNPTRNVIADTFVE